MSKTIEERLHDVARRRNALGKYVVIYTAESILQDLEKKVTEEEGWKAESDAQKAKQVLEDAAEAEALKQFSVGEKITYERDKNRDGSARIETVTVEKIMETGHMLSPCLIVSDSFTKALPQLWLSVKPVKQNANHSQ